MAPSNGLCCCAVAARYTPSSAAPFLAHRNQVPVVKASGKALPHAFLFVCESVDEASKVAALGVLDRKSSDHAIEHQAVVLHLEDYDAYFESDEYCLYLVLSRRLSDSCVPLTMLKILRGETYATLNPLLYLEQGVEASVTTDLSRLQSITKEIFEHGGPISRSAELRVVAEEWVYAGTVRGNLLGKRVLCGHGWMDSAASFEPMAPFLCRDGFLIVALDFIGHGNSSHISSGSFYDRVAYVTQMHHVVQSIGWCGQADAESVASQPPSGTSPLTERFFVVGHSMGGILSQGFTAIFGDLVKKLVLLDALPPTTTTPGKTAVHIRDAILARRKLKASHKVKEYNSVEAAAEKLRQTVKISAAGSILLAQRQTKREKVGDSFSAVAFKHDPLLRLTSPQYLLREQALGLLRAIECEVLLVVPEEGIVNLESHAHYVKEFRRLKVEQVPGRHHFHMEDAERTANIVSRFLDATASKL